MKKKYLKPWCEVCICDLNSTLMAGSNIPVGGTGTKPRYAPRSNDDWHSGTFDAPDYEDARD